MERGAFPPPYCRYIPGRLSRCTQEPGRLLETRDQNRNQSALTTRPVPDSPNVEARPLRAPSKEATEFAKNAAAFLGEKQAEEVTILDVSGPLAIVDYFVLATVRNTRQAQALARELEYDAKHNRGTRKKNAGGLETEDSNWVLLDFDDVVVHLFLPEARQYYGLESLWADAPRVAVPKTSTFGGSESDAAARQERQARPGATQFQVLPTPPPAPGPDATDDADSPSDPDKDGDA